MPIQRTVPQGRQLALPSPDMPFISRNVTVDAFNEQGRASDRDRDRDLSYDQTVEDLRRQADRDRILSDAVLGALSGVVAGPGQNPALAAGPTPNRPQGTMPVVPPAPPPNPGVAKPWVNPDAAQMGGAPGSGPIDTRAYGVNVARGMAAGGHGGAAASALDSVIAGDQQAASSRDKRFEQVFELASKGDPSSRAQAQALAERYGLKIPREILNNARIATAFWAAGKTYGDGDEDRAQRFVQEFISNGGSYEQAIAKAGPPRGKPQEPKGSIIYDEAGGMPYWAPQGGGALEPFTGAPEGARFRRGGPVGQTDPNLSRARLLQNADLAGKAAAGPPPGNDAYPEDKAAWQERYRAGFEAEMARATGPGNSAAGMPPPPPVPSFSMGGPGAAMQPPPDAVQELLRNASPRAIAEFDEVFGPGAAERVLDENGMFGDPD